MRDRFAIGDSKSSIPHFGCIISTKKKRKKKTSLYIPSICPGEDMSKPPFADETLTLSAGSGGILLRHDGLDYDFQCQFLVDAMKYES